MTGRQRHVVLFVPRYPKLKIAPATFPLSLRLPLAGIAPGIFPYLGGSVSVDQLRSVVMAYEGGIVLGRQGAKLAAKTPGSCSIRPCISRRPRLYRNLF